MVISMRILIVEDEAENCSFLKLELEHEGYELYRHPTGEPALTWRLAKALI
jgi:DNA-binding response OmpR family regulator